jgi:ferredoxin
VPAACPDGRCGACETRVLEGVPDHRDAVLTAEERALGETMMICVSGARGDRLVLDL